MPLDSRLRPLGLKVDATTANLEARKWLRDIANMRVHGTTGWIPAELLGEEQGALLRWRPCGKVTCPVRRPLLKSAEGMRRVTIQHPLSVYEGLLAPQVVA